MKYVCVLHFSRSSSTWKTFVDACDSIHAKEKAFFKFKSLHTSDEMKRRGFVSVDAVQVEPNE